MDCIAGMGMIPSNSVDMILCDLPYGMTGCRWDSMIPFGLLWPEYARVIKDNGAIALTSCQPFTTELIQSNRKWFRYCWYWAKNMVTGFANAKKQPLRCVEEVCIFYKRQPAYNPQGIIVLDKPIINRGRTTPPHGDSVYRELSKDTVTTVVHYPRQLLEVKCERGLHPTQKPVALFDYLIRTYTNEGELVLDTCMGSGTTAVACLRSGRRYIGFELDERYCTAAIARIDAEQHKHGGGDM